MEKGGEGADISEEMEKVNNLRTMLEESGKDHLSFYSVLCTSYDVVKDIDDDDNDDDDDDDDDWLRFSLDCIRDPGTPRFY